MAGPEPKGKVQIPVSITPEQLARLAKIAETRGATRNAAVRYVLDKGLRAVEKELGIKPP